MAEAADTPGQPGGGDRASWSARYGQRHRWRRLTDFPEGIEPPRKVRLYRRAGHYILSWWDRSGVRQESRWENGACLLR